MTHDAWGNLHKRIVKLIPSEVFAKIYDRDGKPIDERKIDRWEFLEVLEEAKATFPQIDGFAHSHVEELTPEMIIEQIVDSYGYITAIHEWVREQFGT